MTTPLGQAHQHAAKAWKVWNQGAPKAQSIAQARAQWTPYLQTWLTCIEKDSPPRQGSAQPTLGRERIGWIDADAFWISFWKKRSDEWARGNTTFFMGGTRLRSYFEGACASGSMPFFERMPREFSGDFVQDMSRTRVLMDPRVLDWCCARRPKVDFYTGQCNVLRSLPWQRMDEQHSGLFACRPGTPKREALELLCGSAVTNRYTEESALRDLLGYALVNLVAPGDALDAIERIEQCMAGYLPEGLDLRLLAMCSGHALDGAPASQAMAYLGRSILHGKPSTSKKLSTPAAGIAAMITSLEHIGSLAQLYQAAIQLGLNRRESVTMEVDGFLFGIGP